MKQQSKIAVTLETNCRPHLAIPVFSNGTVTVYPSNIHPSRHSNITLEYFDDHTITDSAAAGSPDGNIVKFIVPDDKWLRAKYTIDGCTYYSALVYSSTQQ